MKFCDGRIFGLHLRCSVVIAMSVVVIINAGWFVKVNK